MEYLSTSKNKKVICANEEKNNVPHPLNYHLPPTPPPLTQTFLYFNTIQTLMHKYLVYIVYSNDYMHSNTLQIKFPTIVLHYMLSSIEKGNIFVISQ